MTKQPIPDTDSIEELAHFWDTHDVTDFEDELEGVTEEIFDLEERIVSIPLHSVEVEVEAIWKIAKSRGVSSTILIRDWVLEKLASS
jgi:hypothetical protein